MSDQSPNQTTKPAGKAGSPSRTGPKVLVAAWIGSRNLGDEMIFHALCRKLAAQGISDITAVSVDPEATLRDHGTRAVSHLNPRSLLQATLRADAVVFGGGGLLQDDTSPWNLPYHLSRLWLATALRRPFVALGLGAGPLHRAINRWMVAHSLRGHRGLTVLDVESARLLERIGVTKGELSADLALSLPIVEQAPQRELAVSLRPFTPKGGLLPVGLRANVGSEAFVSRMAQALDRAAEQTCLHVRFVAFDRLRDDELHRSIAARMSAACSFSAPRHDQAVHEMARATVVVAMRFHAAIAAVLAGRPQVLIGYAPKINSLAEQLGAGAACLADDPDAFEALPLAIERVASHAASIVDCRNKLRSREAINDHVLGRFIDELRAADRSG